MRKLFKQLISLGGIYSIGNIIQNILSVVLVPLYTKFLSPEDFGIVSLISITVTLITKGITPPIIRGFGRFYYKPDYHDKKGVLLFNMFFLLFAEILFISIIFFFLSDYISKTLFSRKDLIYIIKAYSFVLFLTPLVAFQFYFVRLLEKARFFISVSLTKLLLTFAITIFLLVKVKLGVLALIYSEGIGLFFTFLACLPLLLGNFKWKPNISVLKEPIAFGYPQIPSGYANSLIQAGDRYVIRVFNPVSVVGLYSFGYKVAGLVQLLIVEPLDYALQPIIFKKESEPETQKKFLFKFTTYYYALGLLFVLGFSLFAKDIIMMFARKPEFWPSWVIVPVIALSYLQHGLGDLVGWGLIMTNKAFLITTILVISAIVNIGLNFVFIPIWGILGAAYATLVSYFVWNGLKIYYSGKLYGLFFEVKKLLVLTFWASVLYGLSFFIPEQSVFINKLLLKMSLIILYILTLLNNKIISKKEILFIREVFLEKFQKRRNVELGQESI